MNVFELFGKLSLDKSDYDRNLDDAEKKTNDTGGKLKNGLASVGKAVGAATLAALTSATVAVVGITKTAVDAYANYEQLVGGVESIFGENAGTVIENAENAYETAGMSMNDYLDTVMGFSASLIQSFEGDTEKAAQYADIAARDMADNANRYGSDIETLQSAYAGFAKENYTMLDNLKLGYGGTKEGMEELLEAAMEIQEANGIMADYSIDSFADIVEAIHVVQENMGITGTTAKEAADTISGSTQSMRAAWDNFLVELAKDDGDIEGSLDKLMDKFFQVSDNIAPVVTNILEGLAKALEVALPKFAKMIPTLIDKLLPPLVEAVISLTKAVTESLPQILQTISEMIPPLISGLIEIVTENTPALFESLLQLIFSLVHTIGDNLPAFINSVISIIFGIVDVLLQPDTLISLLDAVMAIILGIVEAIPQAIPMIVEKLPEIIEAVITALIYLFPAIVSAVIQLVLSLFSSIGDLVGNLIDVFANMGTQIKNWVKDKLSSAKTWGKDLIDNFVGGIKERFEKVKETISNVGQKIKDFLGFSEPKEGPLSNFHTYAPDMMELFAKGIEDNEDVVTGQIKKSFNFGGQIKGAMPSGKLSGAFSDERPINITVQSILDGRVIGEATTKYARKVARSVGGTV